MKIDVFMIRKSDSELDLVRGISLKANMNRLPKYNWISSGEHYDK